MWSRARLRASAETTRTNRGWWGSLGWPGVNACQTSPRRGSGTLRLSVRAQLPCCGCPAQRVPGRAFKRWDAIRFGELLFQGPLQLSSAPQSQRRIEHGAAILLRVSRDIGVDRGQQVAINGGSDLWPSPERSGSTHADIVADTVTVTSSSPRPRCKPVGDQVCAGGLLPNSLMSTNASPAETRATREHGTLGRSNRSVARAGSPCLPGAADRLGAADAPARGGLVPLRPRLVEQAQRGRAVAS